jgi:hypothetical protein
MVRKSITFILFLFSSIVFAQETPKLISLKQYVEQIKLQNESIKNVENVNVMINDVLIENHEEYKIDPKNVSRMEILVIEPEKNPNGLNPSIIISTRIK